jgi:radical SAM protein (TIGR01212 family)
MTENPIAQEGRPRYRTFNNYLKDYFGQRVYRVPLDAGFTCPNRDGSKAFGGCTFCDDRGSGAPTINASLSIKEQLGSEIRRIRNRYKAKKFLAYFQAFTNTYGPEGVLKELYDTALQHEDVLGLCIGTRPDCLPDNILDLLAEYNRRTFLWLEVGLQTSKDSTLEALNRGHTAYEFFDAIKRAKQRGLKVATHLIFGLPGENERDMMSTVEQVADAGLDGIKIHQLCIYKGTALETDFRQGKLTLLNEAQYVDLVVRALEKLPCEMIVMRLVAEGSENELIAPSWSFEKNRVMQSINEALAQQDSWQGKKCQLRNLAVSHHS